MKYLGIIFFFLLISCVTSKKVYMCGDHTCKNKKEFKKYFAENLIIEIQPQKKRKKNISIDLAKLNTIEKKYPNDDLTSEKAVQLDKNEKKEKIDLKKKILNLKERILAVEKNKKVVSTPTKNTDHEKIKLKKEIINKVDEIPIKVNPKRKILKEKIGNKVAATPKAIPNTNVKYKDAKNSKKIEDFKSTKSKNQISICSKLEDCDIDKIGDLLTERGNKKSFPDITSE